MNGLALEQMRAVDIRTVDPNDLVDIKKIKLCADKPKGERIKDFIEQIKNPYCYRVGKIIVKVSFADCGATLEDRLESLMMKA